MMNKSSSNLKKELDRLDNSVAAFKEFCRRNPEERKFNSLSDFLNQYMADHPTLVQKEVVKKANASKDYANQYFNGHRQHPDKYKLLPLCIAMGMNIKDTNRALMLAGQAQLNIHDHRDAAIIFCINHQYTIEQTNEFLLSNKMNSL